MPFFFCIHTESVTCHLQETWRAFVFMLFLLVNPSDRFTVLHPRGRQAQLHPQCGISFAVQSETWWGCTLLLETNPPPKKKSLQMLDMFCLPPRCSPLHESIFFVCVCFFSSIFVHIQHYTDPISSPMFLKPGMVLVVKVEAFHKWLVVGFLFPFAVTS